MESLDTGSNNSTDGTSVGTASLAWEAPTTNTDGTPLSDLAGFKIYYGTETPVDKTTSEAVNVGNVTEYTLSELNSGTYYFAVTAYDIVGNESDLSEEVNKVVSGT